MKRAHLRLFFLLEVFLLHLLLFSSSSSSSFASAENKDEEKKRPSFPALSLLFSGEEDNERVSDDSLFFFGGEKEGESSLAKQKKFSRHRERDDDSFKPILRKEEKSRGVLIVCSEFAGLVPNGGIGTFYTSLANVLSSKEDEEGKEERFFNVTLVYTQGRKVHGKIHKKLRDEEDDDDDDKRRRRRAEDPFTQWQEYYKDRLNVNLVPLPPHRVSGITYHAATSYAVLDWILLEQAKTNKPFDVIHFADWQGVGYYSLLHKKSGLGLKNSLLMVMTHGPLLWARKANEEKIESVEDLESHFLEMKSVELADVVVSPSEYLLDWMEGEAGWTLAENAFVQPYVLPVEAKEAVREALDVEKYVRDRLGHTSIGEGGGGGGERVDVKESIAGKITSWLRSALMGEKKIEEENVEVAVEEKEKETDDNEDEREESATIELIQEFVFFGRLETRKGVILFCDAIDALLRKLDVKPFKVTFLGSDRNKIDREPSKRFVERRSRPWREEKNRAKVTEVNVFTEKNSAEALRYLLEKGKRRLAVLPSLVENSPLSVFELFGVNAPFIASDAGGMPELVKRRTNVVLSKYEKKEFDILFPRNSVNALSEKLREILDHGFVTNAFESTVDVIKNEQRWVQFHKDVAMSRELMLKSSPSSSSPGAAVLRRMKKITEESEMVRDIVDMRAHNVSKGILIVVATRDVDEKLARTLKSISKQKHVKPKAVVVCTSSERNPAFHQVDKDSKNLDYDLSVVEKIGASLAVCRNFAFKTAILNREKNGFSEIAFVDAGNVLEPHALRVFQSALFRFDANVVTSFAHVYDGTSALAEDADIRKLTSANMRQFQPFLGAAFPVATTRNCMGGPVFMVTLNSLINHAGLVLFDKSHSDGYDVWEILSRLTLNGAKLEVIPRAMFWTGSVMKGTKYTKDDRAGRFATEKLREAVKKAPSPAEFRPIFREEKEKDEL
jgi:glycosyltransferase involved in cell wall biosynthesis